MSAVNDREDAKTTTSSARLEQLLGSPDSSLRFLAVQNPNVSQDALCRLIATEGVFPVLQVAVSACSSETLLKAMWPQVSRVESLWDPMYAASLVATVANDSKCPTSLIEEIFRSQHFAASARVREEVAGNPACPAAILREIADTTSNHNVMNRARTEIDRRVGAIRRSFGVTQDVASLLWEIAGDSPDREDPTVAGVLALYGGH